MTNDYNDWFLVEGGGLMVEGGGGMEKMGERFVNRNEKLLPLQRRNESVD